MYSQNNIMTKGSIVREKKIHFRDILGNLIRFKLYIQEITISGMYRKLQLLAL